MESLGAEGEAQESNEVMHRRFDGVLPDWNRPRVFLVPARHGA